MVILSVRTGVASILAGTIPVSTNCRSDQRAALCELFSSGTEASTGALLQRSRFDLPSRGGQQPCRTATSQERCNNAPVDASVPDENSSHNAALDQTGKFVLTGIVPAKMLATPVALTI